MSYKLVKGEFLIKCNCDECSYSQRFEITDGFYGETENDALQVASEQAKMMAVLEHQKDFPQHTIEDMSVEKSNGIYEFVLFKKLLHSEQNESVKYKTYKKGDVILAGDENFYGLCEVVNGVASICRAKNLTFKPGDVFGLSQLCVNQIRNGDLIADEDETMIAFYNMKELFSTDLKKCLDLYHASFENIFALIDHLKDEAMMLEKKLEQADIQKNNMEIKCESLKNVLFEKK
jgi:CRP-like cAMP-binding protein